MGVISTLSTAQTGLRAASVQIDTAANNVANASTDGYSRRTADLSNSDPVRLGSVYRGTGVSVTGVERAADEFVARQLVGTMGDQSFAEAEYEVLTLAEAWFNDAEIDGLPTMLQEVYDSLTQATADPADASLRRAVASASDAFATSLARTASSIVDLQEQVQDRIADAMSEVNDRVQKVAQLNERVIHSQGDASDLLDQRDRELQELAQLVGIDYFIEQDGSATVLLGGHTLVNGIESRELSLEQDPGEVSLWLEVDSGRVEVSGAAGGRLGGMSKALDRVEGYLDDLDTFVSEIETQFNTQHAAGFDRSGAAGGDWFQTATGGDHISESFSFNVDLLNDPELFAFAGSAAGAAGDGDNLRLMVEMEADTVYTGGISGGESVLRLLTEVGDDTASALRTSEQQAVIQEDLQGMRDAISGVDLDEEAASLIEFQAAYQAAAKVLRTSQTLFETLIQVV